MLSTEELSKLKACRSGDEVLAILREFIKEERYADVWPVIKEHCSSRDCNKSGRKDYIRDGLIPIVSEYVINKDLKGYDGLKWSNTFRKKQGKAWEEVIHDCLAEGNPDFSKGIYAIKGSICDFKECKTAD